ncbi:von Willebrand factor D and EGF domain-containing protein-like isoform X1 [Haliotis rufescens]|nr:von Willebrand factor D and EGF domain-containing protein-like isoform X1 [Haliotis rufescens]
MNGAKCVGPDRCSCPSGWSGRRCDKAVCHLSCQNGGVCFKPDICVCRRGYAGASCQKPLCWPRCRHGGRCIAPQTCRCRRGFRGRFCQRRLRWGRRIESYNGKSYVKIRMMLKCLDKNCAKSASRMRTEKTHLPSYFYYYR